jgi:hypothetical protein
MSEHWDEYEEDWETNRGKKIRNKTNRSKKLNYKQAKQLKEAKRNGTKYPKKRKR